LDSNPRLRLEDIHYNYGPVRILEGVTLELRPGETVVIIGRSGSGKTSLTRIAALLTRPDQGKVIIEGADYANRSDSERSRARLEHIGYLDQHYTLIPTLTLEENILLPLKLAHKPVDEEWLSHIVDALNLKPHLNRLPHRVSGGQRQRAALARALVKKPIILILDEPLSAQDPEHQASIDDLIRSYKQLTKASVLATTTNPNDHLEATKTYVIREGEIKPE